MVAILRHRVEHGAQIDVVGTTMTNIWHGRCHYGCPLAAASLTLQLYLSLLPRLPAR